MSSGTKETYIIEKNTKKLDEKITFYAFISALIIGSGLVFYFLSRTYWASDDFYYLKLIATNKFDYAYITRPSFGHFVPGFHAVWKSYFEIFNNNYLAAQILMGINYIFIIFNFYFLLKKIGLKPVVVNLLSAGLCLSPILFHASYWWAGFISIYLPLNLLLLSFNFALAYIKKPRVSMLVYSAIAHVASVLCFEKNLLLPLYIITFVFFIAQRQTGFKDRMMVLWQQKYLYITLGLISLADLIAFYYYGANDQSPPPPSSSDFLRALIHSLFRYFIPALFGVDPARSSLSHHTIIFISVLILSALAFYSYYRSKKMPVEYFWFLLLFAINEGLILKGRYSLLGINFGMEYRYHIDSLWIFFIAIGITFTKSKVDRKEMNKSLRQSILLIAACLLVVIFANGIRTGIHNHKYSLMHETYLYQKNASKIPDGVEIADGVLPPYLMPYGMYPLDTYSNVMENINGDLKVVSASNNVLLSSGKLAKAQDVVENASTPILITQQCSTKDHPIIVYSATSAPTYFAVTLTDYDNQLSIAYSNSSDPASGGELIRVNLNDISDKNSEVALPLYGRNAPTNNYYYLKTSKDNVCLKTIRALSP